MPTAIPPLPTVAPALLSLTSRKRQRRAASSDAAVASHHPAALATGRSSRRIRFRLVACGVLALLALGLVGCQTAEVAEPLTQTVAGNDVDSQLAFWHTLAERRLTSNDEAFHALLLFLDGEDPATDYAGRVEKLKARGLLHPSFDRPANEAVTRGTLAVAMFKSLKVCGGLTICTFGITQRYALRELEFAGVFPPSSPQQVMSGDEFIDLIGRAEDYQREFDKKAPAQQVAAGK